MQENLMKQRCHLATRENKALEGQDNGLVRVDDLDVNILEIVLVILSRGTKQQFKGKFYGTELLSKMDLFVELTERFKYPGMINDINLINIEARQYSKKLSGDVKTDNDVIKEN